MPPRTKSTPARKPGLTPSMAKRYFTAYASLNEKRINLLSMDMFLGQVETKRATPREEFGKPEAGQTIKKLFLGGLKEEVTDDEILQHFSQFGQVKEVTRLTDKDTGKKKGFGFVEFDDYDPVDKCLLQVIPLLLASNAPYHKLAFILVSMFMS